LESAEDEALYRTGQDLFAMRDSVNQQTQWSVEDALERHHVDLPKVGTDDLVRDAVNAGWESSSQFLSDSKERPIG
jgi:hypothetical protein